MDSTLQRSYQVLLIEDQPADAELFRAWLEDGPARFEVRCAQSLAAAADLLGAPVDVIATDLNLGLSAGVETVRAVRALAPDVPIVVLSGTPGAEQSRLALRMGAVDVVDKNEANARRLLPRSLMFAVERHRAERHGHQVQRLLDVSPDGMFVVDRDGRIQYVNDAAVALLGRPRAELLGEPLAFSAPDGVPVEITVRRGSESRPAELRVLGVDATSGTTLASVRDLVEKRRVEILSEQLKLFEEVVESAACGMLLVNEGGNIVYANREASRMLGYDPSELVGGPVEALVPAALSTHHGSLREAYVAAPTPRAMGDGRDLCAVRKDGSQIRIQVGLAPLNLDGVRILVSLIDVTAAADARAALIRARDDLEAEVSRRTESLVRSNKDLERFAYVASHDLREPLRMVASYTDLLSAELGDRLDDDAQLYLKFANDGARRMQKLLDDLLAYSRVAIDGRPAGRADADEALDVALANLHLAIVQSGATIVRERLPEVEIGRSQLVQVLQNLVGNAIKFAGPSPPWIRIGAVRGERSHELFVEDRGIGLDMKHASDIFLLFRRLHRDDVAGTGLGLAIVERVVAGAGGRIWVESEPGRGATFRFVLPSAGSNDPPDGASPHP